MALAELNADHVAAEQKLQAYYLAMFDRLLPLGYLDGLKSPGPGYELLQAFAKLAERMSTAVAHYKVAGLVATAAGGQLAQGTVSFTRTGAAAVTVKAGTVVRASNGQRDFVLVQDVVFGAGVLGPLTGTVQAAAFGYEWNLPGPRTTASGDVIPGEIDTMLTPVTDPSYADPTLTVAQVTDTTGGQDAVLDQIGLDMSLPRASGETDLRYAVRITTLPDTVSPGAIERACHAALDPYGATFQLIEVPSILLQTCYDGPSAAIPGSLYDPNLFTYDDPRVGYYNNIWLPGRVGFIIVIDLFTVLDFGMAYDDTTNTVIGFTRHGVGAWDVPPTLATGEVQGFYDGYDTGRAALLKGLYESLVQIKAAGVPFTFELPFSVGAPTHIVLSCGLAEVATAVEYASVGEVEAEPITESVATSDSLEASGNVGATESVVASDAVTAEAGAELADSATVSDYLSADCGVEFTESAATSDTLDASGGLPVIAESTAASDDLYAELNPV